ncbi:BZ3500_MvSof-1268-A1-R1_Chr1-3g02498 [Microbotryum saponariae]|uniref:BZ3500_MvSof-1268-A1-R1_Chr1-3g02498 protein n=1 Tax=Microbotryum saponariae TaxID=289078 RepID=A0A2X0MW00_9BASI|nr:BZ3500_MvSof-1268-A1-R1_Chr1-3g02498 [Microbotryum saponariae]SCZ96405.1 BZ3501_MvSof-1269-A2-R1_Chr1-3g02101 [Microbotryum saponariae]
MVSDVSSLARSDPRSALDKLTALPSITDSRAALTDVGFDFNLRDLPREPFTPSNHISDDDGRIS